LYRLARAIAQIVKHGEFGTNERTNFLAQISRQLFGAAAAVFARADVHINAPAVGADIAIGLPRFGQGAGDFGGTLHLQAGVFQRR